MDATTHTRQKLLGWSRGRLVEGLQPDAHLYIYIYIYIYIYVYIYIYR